MSMGRLVQPDVSLCSRINFSSGVFLSGLYCIRFRVGQHKMQMGCVKSQFLFFFSRSRLRSDDSSGSKLLSAQSSRGSGCGVVGLPIDPMSTWKTTDSGLTENSSVVSVVAASSNRRDDLLQASPEFPGEGARARCRKLN